jgi:endogenous inhibitor of DNA gyrase (YacG/DUF329 family)
MKSSGYLYEYVSRKMTPEQVEQERRRQLKRIADLRGSAVLSYMARLSTMPVPAPTAILYDDILPFTDMLGDCKGDRIAVILETHGGVGEVGRELVELLHEKFKHVTFIVPGTAKSTGSIMVLGADEILMGSASSLGPIDAQLVQPDGKQYSADALLEGFNRIKDEVAKSGKLNAAYIPILQKLSPGELEHANNALQFAKETVAEWLVRYKFREWNTHTSNGQPVTPEEKRQRADEIASKLCSQAQWRTHGRSIRIPDLLALRVRITNYEDQPELRDAIGRYYVLARMTFEQGNVYKIFETPAATLALRFSVQVGNVPPQQADSVIVEAQCPNCQSPIRVQIDFRPGVPRDPAAVRYPKGGELPCPSCGKTVNLQPALAELEKQVGKKALDPQPTD